jgi:hypothetical protein
LEIMIAVSQYAKFSDLVRVCPCPRSSTEIRFKASVRSWLAYWL